MSELPEVSNVELGEEQNLTNENVDSQEIAKESSGDGFVQLDQDQQKKFNKLTWQANEERRKNAALQKQIDEMQAAKPVVTPSIPDVVAMPDEDLSYSDPDAYRKQMSDWKQSVINEAKTAAKGAAESHFQTEQTQAQQLKNNALVEERTNAFRDRASNTGLNAEQMIKAEEVLLAYNPSPDLANFLIDDEQGPQLVNYLANNQAELADIVQMQPMKAALKLNELRSKAVNVKTSTKAPDPIETLGGRGMPEQEHPALRGATFE